MGSPERLEEAQAAVGDLLGMNKRSSGESVQLRVRTRICRGT